ncbi:MAG: ATP-binding cassette domain-containing protein [Firmicutes bacterium]|nr:ATP-binding cassette domain-containing protein [Bacillota bacterium]
MEKLLQIHNITKIFGEGTINEKVAIDNLSLTLEEGDFVTVIGNNGAGKSTLMNAIAGVFPMDAGKLVIGDKDVTKLAEHKRAKYIGRVFQDPLKGTAFDMTIEENLAIAACKAKNRGLQPGITKNDKKAFREQLQVLDMGLEDKLTQKVKLLSGGQRQALTLFMATMAEPKILLLDEHTAALDPAAAEKVLALTEKFARKEGMCTLMITHNMKDALKYGNRTILMKDGKIVMDIKGEERADMTVEKLISKFNIDNDRMML